MHPDAEHAAARYVQGVPAPSVIALNGLFAMEAVNQFMFAVTGLHSAPRTPPGSCTCQATASEPANYPAATPPVRGAPRLGSSHGGAD